MFMFSMENALKAKTKIARWFLGFAFRDWSMAISGVLFGLATLIAIKF